MSLPGAGSGVSSFQRIPLEIIGAVPQREMRAFLPKNYMAKISYIHYRTQHVHEYSILNYGVE